MVELNNWDIWRGRIRGTIVETGKVITTSPVMSREGNVVTTRSRNKYKLLECDKDAYINQQEIRDLYWKGTKDEWECLDVQINIFNKRKETENDLGDI